MTGTGARSRRPGRKRRVVPILLGAAVSLLVLALIGREVFFSGPYRSPQALAPERFIDLHVHTAGIGAGGSGCRISPALRQSYKFGLYLSAFGVTQEEVESRGDALLMERISQMVSASRTVKAVVVLALDGVIDAAGELDRNRTEIFVPNEFLVRETARYTNLLFGASINPHRKDALEQLDRAAAHGAVLVKWIPSIMAIDPSDRRWIPFYERMKRHGLPLLTHTGRERSFTFAEDTLADPERLRLPLELGLTVIAAHVASTGENGGEPDIERLARMMNEFPNLRAEISSLTQVNKLGYLQQALSRPEFADRLCYGSDFPLINTALVSPWYFPMQLTRVQMEEIARIENPWDRDVALKQALGVPAEVFENSARWLDRPGDAAAARHPGAHDGVYSASRASQR